MANAKSLRSRIATVAVAALGAGLLVAAPASAAVTSISVAQGASRAGVGAFLLVTPDDAATGGMYRFVVRSQPAGGGLTLNSAVTSSPAINSAQATKQVAIEIAQVGDTSNVPQAPGTYNLLVWFDANGNSSGDNTAPSASAPTASIDYVVAGAPTQLTYVSSAKTANKTEDSTFEVRPVDANGRVSLLTTDESISVQGSAAVAGTLKVEKGTATSGAGVSTPANKQTVSLTAGDARTTTDGTASGTLKAIGGYYVTANFSVAGTVSLAASAGGLLTGLVTSATATLTATNYAYATGISVYSTKGVKGATLSGGTYGSVSALTTDSATASVRASNVTGLAITYKITGTADSTVRYAIAAVNTSTALPAGVTAGTYEAALDADGEAYVTVTATSATSGAGYKVAVARSNDSTVSNVYTVLYEAPTVDGAGSQKGSVTLNPDADNSTKFARTINGGSTTITATVKDQFGDVFAGANVQFLNSAGRNSTGATTVSVTSDATGKASFTLTDAKSTSTTTTDTVSVQAAASTVTTFTAAVTTVITYSSNVTVTTLGLTNGAAVTTGAFTTDEPGEYIDNDVTFTATAKDANGIVMSGILVTFTVNGNGYLKSTSSATAYTNASGVATAIFRGYKAGTVTVTATAGGATKSSSFPTANQATDVRAIALDSTTADIAGGSAKKFTATATDRYGNVVAGVSVTVSLTGTAGRIAAINGASAQNTATTAANGTVVIDVATLQGESGTATLKVSFTGGDTSTSTKTSQGAAYPARATSSSAPITVTKVKSDAEIAADAAKAEAAKAIAAADAAKAEAAKATAAIAALSTTITSIQTAISTLVASVTATLTVISTQIAKVMAKLKIK